MRVEARVGKLFGKRVGPPSQLELVETGEGEEDDSPAMPSDACES